MPDVTLLAGAAAAAAAGFSLMVYQSLERKAASLEGAKQCRISDLPWVVHDHLQGANNRTPLHVAVQGQVTALHSQGTIPTEYALGPRESVWYLREEVSSFASRKFFKMDYSTCTAQVERSVPFELSDPQAPRASLPSRCPASSPTGIDYVPRPMPLVVPSLRDNASFATVLEKVTDTFKETQLTYEEIVLQENASGYLKKGVQYIESILPVDSTVTVIGHVTIGADGEHLQLGPSGSSSIILSTQSLNEIVQQYRDKASRRYHFFVCLATVAGCCAVYSAGKRLLSLYSENLKLQQQRELQDFRRQQIMRRSGRRRRTHGRVRSSARVRTVETAQPIAHKSMLPNKPSKSKGKSKKTKRVRNKGSGKSKKNDKLHSNKSMVEEKEEQCSEISSMPDTDDCTTESPTEVEETNVEGNCLICLDTKADAVLLDCGHMYTCIECAEQLMDTTNQCPVCRGKIRRFVKVYAN